MKTTIKHESYSYYDLKDCVQVATFAPLGGMVEHHAMLHVGTGYHPLYNSEKTWFENQLDLLHQLQEQLHQLLPHARVVMRRYLVSDIANQAPIIRKVLEQEGLAQGAVSIIGQPPLDGTKVALWLYLTEGAEVEEKTDWTRVSHNGYQHYWTTNHQSLLSGSHDQTQEILAHYESELHQQGLNLADHCQRTWFYVRDVDTNYHGLVVARRDHFTLRNLTPETHYIASTGIGAQPIQQQSLVQMDAYATDGVQPEQIQYLQAPTHLNPTHEYGVTFERGTALHYGDRSHLFISGTASINNQGQVVHVGDVEAQTERMLENIGVLLAEGGADWADVAQAIIYLRDGSDYGCVERLLNQRIGT